MTQPKVILPAKKLHIILNRLCKQLIENHGDFNNTVIIGVQPRGVFFARKLMESLQSMLPQTNILYGDLDVTFYRDDYRHRDAPAIANTTTINFDVEGKKVILVDDVFFTGRTIRAAMAALLDYGRPEKVELLVLINRRFKRHLPVQPDYIGYEVDSIQSQKVKVLWDDTKNDDKVLMIEKDE